jgi:hypothetical protein
MVRCSTGPSDGDGAAGNGNSIQYATFEHGGRERVGLVDTVAGRIHPLDVDGMIATLARPRAPTPDLPLAVDKLPYLGDHDRSLAD